MKRLVLGLGILSLFATSSFAFKSGAYVCSQPYVGDVVYTIKSNSKYKIESSFGSERGPWIDYDDAATLMTNKGEVVIEKSGNGYRMGGDATILGIACERVDINKLDNFMSDRKLNQKKAQAKASEERKIKQAKLDKQHAKEQLKVAEANRKLEKERLVLEKDARETKLVVDAEIAKKDRIAELENEKIKTELLKKEQIERKKQAKLDKAQKAKKDLALQGQQQIKNKMKRDEKKVERNSRKALRNKKKEILAIWENFDKKYNFSKGLKKEAGRGNAAKLILTDDVLDAYFDMKDELETKLPSLVPSGKYGNRFSGLSDKLEKYYDYNEESRISHQPYTENSIKGAIKHVKKEIDKLKQ